MKKIWIALLCTSAMFMSYSTFAEWQGSGFKVIGHVSFTSPSVKNSWVKEVDSQDLLKSPDLLSVTVSSRDVYTKVHEYADLISNHSIIVINPTSQTQIYKAEILLACGVGIKDEIFYLQVNPNGKANNNYQLGMAEEVDIAGIYDIKTFTRVEGIENNFMELHYKFYARQ